MKIINRDHVIKIKFKNTVTIQEKHTIKKGTVLYAEKHKDFYRIDISEGVTVDVPTCYFGDIFEEFRELGNSYHGMSGICFDFYDDDCGLYPRDGSDDEMEELC